MERVPPPFPAAAALAALDEVLMDTPLSPKHLHLSALGEKRAALFSVSKSARAAAIRETVVCAHSSN
eukprot:scaffold49369_cov29-Tisochrysis_lutea.AAC.2